MITMSRSEVRRRAIQDPLKMAERYITLQSERDLLARTLKDLVDAAHDLSRAPKDDIDAENMAGLLNNRCAIAFRVLEVLKDQ